MAKRKTGKAKSGSLLWKVGVWATWWWGVSCAYVLLLTWQSRDVYAFLSVMLASNSSLYNWRIAVSNTYSNTTWLQGLLALIVIGWIVGIVFWLKALKQSKISYKAGFKDLFLTLRR